ncbi:kinase-like domain-containing protein, partial [Suillus placidus]
LMDSTGIVHVADHGIIAMYFELSHVSYIRSNVQWAAPELFDVPDNEEYPTTMPASDIHSFGCIILQVFRIHPFGEHEVPVMILKGKKPGRRAWSPHIDDSLWDLIERCWSSDSGHRPSAAEVSRFLQPEPQVGLVVV